MSEDPQEKVDGHREAAQEAPEATHEAKPVAPKHASNPPGKPMAHGDEQPKVKPDASAGMPPKVKPAASVGAPPKVKPALHDYTKFTRLQRASIQKFRGMTVAAFYGVLVLGMVVGTLFFVRPTASAVENRNLTPFPELTWETFWDGSFFADLSLWYADTYPPREFLMELDKGLKSLYGVQPEATMVGGVEEAEEVPEEAEQQAEVITVEEFTAPDADALAMEVQNSIMDGLYVKDGAAYSKYYFTESVAQKYASVINTFASKLEGKAEVYSILIPDQSGVLLSESELHGLGGSSQGDAIKYYDSLMSDQVKKINAYQTLRDHNSEYIYFRSDHHWTQLGAYYTYVKYCEEAGIEPISLEDHQMLEFDGFLGSFYQKLNDATMGANPDYVDAYVPNGTNEMRYLDKNGAWNNAKVITDVSAWNKGSKYQCFIAGDQPLVEIENPQIEEDSSVLLVKESFGNAFAPLLVDNYKRVYVIDYRYYAGNIVDFVEQNEIQNVIFLNNITHASTNGVVDKLATMM